MRSELSAIDAEHRKKAADQAMTLFIASELFKNSEHIACYFPRDIEFNDTPIIRAIWAAKKKCYLPVLVSGKQKMLHFVFYAENDSLTLNRFKIFEPESTEFFSARNLDLVLLPLYAYDLHGNRLGTGGGFYDRTFEFVKEKIEAPFLLGVGYQFQAVPQLPSDTWDVKLNGVLSENQLVIFS